MKILGIETSCDETAASVIEKKGNQIKVLSNVVSSQIEIHKKYGGVVPEVAAREHVLNILPVVNEALIKGGFHTSSLAAQEVSGYLDSIAVTTGPGLITSLLTGVETAKTLSCAWGVHAIPINHIEGHIAANFIGDSLSDLQFPVLILTVSGGHTMLVLMKGFLDYETIGETRDDAAGEAFDKAAKLMGIGYPGGPLISKKAESASQEKKAEIQLPRPMIDSPDFDFSFSGLKTAIRYAIEKDSKWQDRIPEYCQEFQQAVVDVLVHKTIKAAKKFAVKSIMLAGGVSANQELRRQLEKSIETKLANTKYYTPCIEYTTDNAAMIAAAGAIKAEQEKFVAWQDLRVDCNLEL